jgi:hypothetical protein
MTKTISNPKILPSAVKVCCELMNESVNTLAATAELPANSEQLSSSCESVQSE